MCIPAQNLFWHPLRCSRLRTLLNTCEHQKSESLPPRWFGLGLWQGPTRYHVTYFPPEPQAFHLSTFAISPTPPLSDHIRPQNYSWCVATRALSPQERVGAGTERRPILRLDSMPKPSPDYLAGIFMNRPIFSFLLCLAAFTQL